MAREAMGLGAGAESALLTILVVTSVPSIYSQLLPPSVGLGDLFDAPGAETLPTQIRRAEGQAALISLGLGAMVSMIARTPWPFLAAAALVGWNVWEYENRMKCLRHEDADRSDNDGLGLQ